MNPDTRLHHKAEGATFLRFFLKREHIPASDAVDAAPGPLLIAVICQSFLVVACALQAWGAGERDGQ